jgi:hypothetical protein
MTYLPHPRPDHPANDQSGPAKATRSRRRTGALPLNEGRMDRLNATLRHALAGPPATRRLRRAVCPIWPRREDRLEAPAIWRHEDQGQDTPPAAPQKTTSETPHPAAPQTPRPRRRAKKTTIETPHHEHHNRNATPQTPQPKHRTTNTTTKTPHHKHHNQNTTPQTPQPKHRTTTPRPKPPPSGRGRYGRVMRRTSRASSSWVSVSVPLAT